ncbi:hypothetical protein D3C80_2168510 [compost metagenome]
MLALRQRAEKVVGQQTGALRQRLHHQDAGENGSLVMAGPKGRLIGGNVFDGA